MKTMTLALTQMGLDIPDALGVIGKTRTLLLSGCPIALSQLVRVHVVTNYHSTMAWPRVESLAAALYIANFQCELHYGDMIGATTSLRHRRMQKVGVPEGGEE